MSTKFSSTADAAAQLAGDPTVGKRVKGEIRRNQVVSTLLAIRIDKGMNQNEVAAAMGCDPSTVSRIESGNDRQLKWTDIVGYASALKVNMSLFIDDESLSSTARIKHCVFKIDEDLNRLAELAKICNDDPKILQAINQFYKDVMFNFALRYGINESKLNSVIKITPKLKQVSEESEGSTCEGQPERTELLETSAP